MAKSYKEILPQIKALIFDVDGVLTDGTIQVSENGQLLRTMNVKDGYALKIALEEGLKICVISGGSNEGVRNRLKGLGIKDIYLKSHDKIQQFQEYIENQNLSPENILYMGDDLPDLPVMKMVGLPCSPKDAVPEIHGVSKYISHKKGGKGCARDVIEQILKVQGKWNRIFDAQYD